MTRVVRTTRVRGFTLIELMVVVVIIILLAALTVVAAGSFIRGSRRSAEQQSLRSLCMATEQFEQRFKFSVPLVDDFDSAGPVVAGTDNDRVRIAGESARDPSDAAPQQAFLSYENPAFEDTTPRYSELSLPYYLVGVLSKKVDGVDGPGMTAPLATARGGPNNWRSFDKKGGTIQPLMDVSNDPSRLVRMDANGTPLTGVNSEQQSRLADRWGRAVRYYRWEPLFHVTGAAPAGRSGAPANNATQAGEVRDYNAPYFLGDPRENASLRPAKWALVSRGADGLINESNPNDAMNADNIVIIQGGSAIEGGGQ